jgi:hypothetical protein
MVRCFGRDIRVLCKLNSMFKYNMCEKLGMYSSKYGMEGLDILYEDQTQLLGEWKAAEISLAFIPSEWRTRKEICSNCAAGSLGYTGHCRNRNNCR